jgi:predicted Zn-dependent protease
MKALIQFLAIVFSFVMIWLSLSLIDWRTVLHIEDASNTTEEKLGDLIWESIQKTEDIITKDTVLAPLDSILNHICDKNDIDRKDIKLHLIRKDEINAFALPDNHLVVYTGLIEACTNEAELAGVLCHELAHIQKRHVMKKLVKEVGLRCISFYHYWWRKYR